MPGDIINEIFSIDNDLKMGYQLKELFLDIVYHAEIDDVERQKEESQNATGYVFTGGAFVGNTREYDTYIQ